MIWVYTVCSGIPVLILLTNTIALSVIPEWTKTNQNGVKSGWGVIMVIETKTNLLKGNRHIFFRRQLLLLTLFSSAAF